MAKTIYRNQKIRIERPAVGPLLAVAGEQSSWSIAPLDVIQPFVLVASHAARQPYWFTMKSVDNAITIHLFGMGRIDEWPHPTRYGDMIDRAGEFWAQWLTVGKLSRHFAA